MAGKAGDSSAAGGSSEDGVLFRDVRSFFSTGNAPFKGSKVNLSRHHLKGKKDPEPTPEVTPVAKTLPKVGVFRRPAAAVESPAAASGQPVKTEAANDGEFIPMKVEEENAGLSDEEGGEEELDFEPDEVVDDTDDNTDAAVSATASGSATATGSTTDTATIDSMGVTVLMDDRVPTHFDLPLCSRCRMPVMAERFQLKCKGTPSFKCNHCNVKQVQLSQHGMTATVTKLVKDFTKEQEATFFCELNKKSSIADVKQYIEDTLVAERKTGKVTADGGGYFPLGYYRKKGFPVRKILSHCSDSMQHPVLGKVYKVDILSIKRHQEEWASKRKTRSSTEAVPAPPMKKVRKLEQHSTGGTETTEASATETAVSASQEHNKKKTSKKEKTAKKAKKSSKKEKKAKKAKTKSSKKKKSKKSSSSSSGSSSDSERTRKKKESADARKAQVEKKKQDVERAKEVKTAFAILAKLASADAGALTDATKDPLWQHIPEWAKKQTAQVLKSIASMHTSVKAVTTSKSPLEHSIEEAIGFKRRNYTHLKRYPTAMLGSVGQRAGWHVRRHGLGRVRLGLGGNIFYISTLFRRPAS